MDRKDAEKVWGKEWSHDIELIGGAIDKLALEKHARILDVGTGFGIMAISLAVDGFDVLTGEPKEEHGKHEWWHEQHSTGMYSDWREAAKSLGLRWVLYDLRAWLRGRRASHLAGLPWEELLPMQLDTVRRLGGIEEARRAHPHGILAANLGGEATAAA